VESLAARLTELAAGVDSELQPRFRYADGSDGAGGTVPARMERLHLGRGRDRRLGWTGEGPHRARPECRIAGEELAAGASRGYTRLYSILLRFALAGHFEERRGESPVLLLDDPESELDGRWIGRLLRLLPERSQVIVTACRELTDLPARFRRIPIESLAAAGVAT
jgi:DNA replication and repair protein RecF